jgi:hypothetical protein
VRCAEIKTLKAMRGVEVNYCNNVHAKCYLNEEFGIVTSLNLYDFSEAKNLEMGVLFHRTTDSSLYQRVSEEAERIIRISGGESIARHGVKKPAERTVLTAAIFRTDEVSTAQLADTMGVMVTALYDKLIGRGYLERGTDGKRRLTDKGKAAGGKSGEAVGASFLWPPDLQV